jgi:hypothetical protein
MLSTAGGGKTNVTGKMNNAETQKQGGIAQKRGEHITKGSDGRGTWGPLAPKLKST